MCLFFMSFNINPKPCNKTLESLIFFFLGVFTDEWSSRGLCAPDDLTTLSHLHEAAVLDSLNIRFETDCIYTFTGPILIAVNPFKTIRGMYDYSVKALTLINPKNFNCG